MSKVQSLVESNESSTEISVQYLMLSTHIFLAVLVFVSLYYDVRHLIGDAMVYGLWRRVIGVNISERKIGTERTKKRKKRELVFFPPPGCATGTVVRRLDATLILPELR